MESLSGLIALHSRCGMPPMRRHAVVAILIEELVKGG
jgi:hypothetical protein